MAGLTRVQKLWHRQQEDRKRREYNEQMAVRREQKRMERETIGMLLDAGWDNDYDVFIKITKSTHPNDLVSHWETFYNELGEEVPRPKGYKSA